MADISWTMLETLGDVVSKSVHCILKYVELMLQIIILWDSKNTKGMIQKIDKYIKSSHIQLLWLQEFRRQC